MNKNATNPFRIIRSTNPKRIIRSTTLTGKSTTTLKESGSYLTYYNPKVTNFSV